MQIQSHAGSGVILQVIDPVENNGTNPHLTGIRQVGSVEKDFDSLLLPDFSPTDDMGKSYAA